MQLPLPFGYIANLPGSAAPSRLIWFCHTKYNTSNAFLLAGYSAMLLANVFFNPLPITLPVALGCNTSH